MSGEMDSSFTHDLSSSSSSTFSMRRCDELRILENSRNRSEASDLNRGLAGRDGLKELYDGISESTIKGMVWNCWQECTNCVDIKGLVMLMRVLCCIREPRGWCPISLWL